MTITYETLLDEAYDRDLMVKEKPLQGTDGLQCGNRIAIRSDIERSNKKKCVLAEEIGHYMTSVGNIINQSDLDNARQEHRARVWAYHKLLSIDMIIDAAKEGYTEVYEIAEYLDIDEEFLRDYLMYQGILDMSM
ncbi:MAG: ImmA/IrrE family metallo-endopeptidase [Firmicutes bacterium]|nr:ImmA/IrrE family metallo-endopeptidase [Bacillota bacterium]